MKIKVIFLIISVLFPFVLFASSTTCPLSSGINVHTAKRILNICKQGAVVRTFKVALGYNGVGKKRAGDNKTPIGLYGLSHPRKSSEFKIFIPIAYPTSKQVAAGYTGRDVGIHGSKKSSAFFWLNSVPGSTRGCIALANNHIDYLANWVKANPGSKVLII